MLAAMPFDDEADAVRSPTAPTSGWSPASGRATAGGSCAWRARSARGQVFVNNYGAGGGVELPFGGVKPFRPRPREGLRGAVRIHRAQDRRAAARIGRRKSHMRQGGGAEAARRALRDAAVRGDGIDVGAGGDSLGNYREFMPRCAPAAHGTCPTATRRCSRASRTTADFVHSSRASSTCASPRSRSTTGSGAEARRPSGGHRPRRGSATNRACSRRRSTPTTSGRSRSPTFASWSPRSVNVTDR